MARERADGVPSAAVSHDRLSRHEINWLLAQEARGAAKSLRDEVSGLARPGLSSEPRIAPVETTLDALDDAIEMLTALNTGARGKPRRGRIDLASLLCEVAPTARISIEPGAGTEVFGEESDLRRMLSVLATQASVGAGAEPEVHICRQTDWIKISVELGPDVAATGELERRWLSRMATRHGGWVELEGGTQSILLQADGASDQREVTELRKELQQAQQLGEAYARELATMLAGGDVRTEPPPAPERARNSLPIQALRGAAFVLERTLRSVMEGLRADATLAAGLADGSELAQTLHRRAAALTEVVADLALVGEVPPEEAVSTIDLATAVRSAIGAAEQRAHRHEVTLEAKLPETFALGTRPALLATVLKLLVVHAVSATPRGGVVRVSLYATELGAVVAIEDGGPPVPESLRIELARNETDPASLGRPLTISLLAAHYAATAMGAEVALRDGEQGSTETWLVLQRTAP